MHPLGGGSPPEGSGADWAQQLRARLLDQRVVFVSGALDEAVAGQAAMELMTLDAAGDEPVQLQLESPEGSLDAALTLMDVVELMGVDVHATALGVVGGASVGVLALARRRRAAAHTRFHLAEPASAFEGQGREVARWADERRARWRRFCERVGGAVGRPSDEVDRDFSTGRYLSAEEALAYGFVHEILSPTAHVRRFPGPPMGFRP